MQSTATGAFAPTIPTVISPTQVLWRCVVDSIVCESVALSNAANGANLLHSTPNRHLVTLIGSGVSSIGIDDIVA
eukprot:m.394645 g.394645  ORF g.394645 m.394645 type:complete len:75 (+) comp21090_c0_seq2:1753-1977(+)